MGNKSSRFTLWPLYPFLYVLCFSLFVGPFLLLFLKVDMLYLVQGLLSCFQLLDGIFDFYS